MANHLFIVPGYSDEDFSFLPLKNLLIDQGLYESKNIHSIEYASLNDHADFRDFADRLDEIYEDFFPGLPRERIDVLAHSTGSLVVRAWMYLRRMRQRVRGKTLDVPVEHLFLFAPANFGSDLAKIGQSPLNALRITFTKLNKKATLIGNQNPFETGRKVLQGLEPASPTQWELSTSDLHRETYFGEHDPTGLICYPFIFASGRNFPNLESIIVKELQKDGTDSTVRIAGTSLNTRMCKLRNTFDAHGNSSYQIDWDNELIDGTTHRKKFGNIAFAIYDAYDHCGIINDNGNFRKPKSIDENAWERSEPHLPDNWEPLNLLRKAKEIEAAEDYKILSKSFQEITDGYKSQRESVFQQFFFKVIDDTGLEITDYFIRFFVCDLDGKVNEEHTKSFRNSFGNETSFHIHSVNASYRVLMLDIKAAQEFINTDLSANSQIKMEIVAKSPYNGVSFPNVEFVIYDSRSRKSSLPAFFFPFTTTLVEIILDRKVDKIILDTGDFNLGSGSNSPRRII